MDSYPAIQSRWNFAVPEEYRRMQQSGFFDHTHPHYIELSDVEWFALDHIAGYKPMDFQIAGLVPFAMEASASTWTWMRNKPIHGQTRIAHCPHDEGIAEVFAPDFNSCVYRLILQDLRSTWLIGNHNDIATPDDATRAFRRYARDLEPYFNPKWTARLDELLKRPFREMPDTCIGLMGGPELQSILAEDLDFEELDLQFYHYELDENPMSKHLSGYFRSYQIFASHFTPAEVLDPAKLHSLNLAEPVPVIGPQSPCTRFTLNRDFGGTATPIYFYYYPTTSFNPAKLRPFNLVSPACISVKVPIESTTFFLDYLRAIEDRRAFYIFVGEELIPLQTFLAKSPASEKQPPTGMKA